MPQRRQQRPARRPPAGGSRRRPGDSPRRAATVPGPPPPRGLWTHFRGALRELVLQRIAGWRLGAVVVIIVGGLAGGKAIADAADLDDGWAEAGLQAGLIVVLTLLVALVVAVGRARNARRL